MNDIFDGHFCFGNMCIAIDESYINTTRISEYYKQKHIIERYYYVGRVLIVCRKPGTTRHDIMHNLKSHVKLRKTYLLFKILNMGDLCQKT